MGDIDDILGDSEALDLLYFGDHAFGEPVTYVSPEGESTTCNGVVNPPMTLRVHDAGGVYIDTTVVVEVKIADVPMVDQRGQLIVGGITYTIIKNVPFVGIHTIEGYHRDVLEISAALR